MKPYVRSSCGTFSGDMDDPEHRRICLDCAHSYRWMNRRGWPTARFWRWGFWFRLWRYGPGFSLVNHHEFPPHFSERNGLGRRRYFHIGPWCFRTLPSTNSSGDA